MKSEKSLKMIFPCKINWEDMSAGTIGKYCAVCKKDIADYTAHNKIENSAEVFCGRFSADQISFNTSEYEIKNFKALSLSLLSLLGAVIPMQDLQAQDNQIYQNSKDSADTTNFSPKFSQLRFPLKLEGSIRDKGNNTQISNAEIKLIQNNKLVYKSKTDASGKFSFVLYEKDLTDSVFDLKVSYAGTDQPFLADSILKIPLLNDSIKHNTVFLIEFLLAPLLTVDPRVQSFIVNKEFLWDVSKITTAGVVMPDPKFMLSGTCTISPAKNFIATSGTLGVVNVTANVPAKTELSHPDTVIISAAIFPEEKSEVHHPEGKNVWPIAAGFAALLTFFLVMFKRKSKRD